MTSQPHRHVVTFSGGITSWAVARKVAETYGTENLTLLFADTLVEDEDLYRFIDQAADDIGVPITRVADGRTPWEVFADQRIIGNSLIAPCSKLLKQIPSRRWLEQHTDPDHTTVYVGIDWTETHRLPAIEAGHRPWQVKAPLCDPPFSDKSELLDAARKAGITPPRLYELGFAHNNCGGACVRAGQAQWAHLLKVFPDRYAANEAAEQHMRTALGKNVAILRDRRGGTVRPLPLTDLRHRITSTSTRATTETPYDPDDWGGCGCYTAIEEKSMPPAAPTNPVNPNPNPSNASALPTGPSRPARGAAILDQLHACLTKYVILPSPEAIDAVALWIAATHAQTAWAHAPRLVIRAPEKRCGKSRLLDVVEGTCHDPLITVNASPAAVYRAIGTGHPPTLLVDEADTLFGGKNADANEDLRGLLNAGHQRNRPAIRWDASSQRLEKIPTFAMAALAGIGAMPDTIEDRAVVIRMRRRAAGEQVAPYRHRRDSPALRCLAQQLAGWLHAHLAALEAAEPPMPVEDRAADTWEPLVAVADLAGGTWPARARHAVTTLTAEANEAGNVSHRVRLLADIRTAFTTLGNPTAAPTADLLAALNGDPEAPWADSGPNGLTGKKLGDLLREFDIRSDTIRFPVGQAKGYNRDAFTDAWQRYCPAPETPSTGVSVPSVPTSFPQVIPGTDYPAGTDRSVPQPTLAVASGTH